MYIYESSDLVKRYWVGLYRILILPDIRPIILPDTRYPANSKYRIFSYLSNFWSLFHSYFIHIEKVLKKKFAYSKFASFVQQFIRIPDIKKGRISGTTLVLRNISFSSRNICEIYRLFFVFLLTTKECPFRLMFFNSLNFDLLKMWREGSRKWSMRGFLWIDLSI